MWNTEFAPETEQKEDVKQRTDCDGFIIKMNEPDLLFRLMAIQIEHQILVSTSISN